MISGQALPTRDDGAAETEQSGEFTSSKTYVHQNIVETIGDLGEAHARSVALMEELERQLQEAKQMQARPTLSVPAPMEERSYISDEHSESSVSTEDESSSPTEQALPQPHIRPASCMRASPKGLQPTPPRLGSPQVRLRGPRRQSLEVHRTSIDMSSLTIGSVPNARQTDPVRVQTPAGSGRFNKFLHWLDASKKLRESHSGMVGALTQDPPLPYDLRIAYSSSSCVEGRRSSMGNVDCGMGTSGLTDLMEEGETLHNGYAEEEEGAFRAFTPLRMGRVPPNLRHVNGPPALRAASFTAAPSNRSTKAGSALSPNPVAAAQAASIAFSAVGQPAQRLQMRTSLTGPSGPMSCPLSGQPNSISGVRGGSRGSAEHLTLLSNAPVSGSGGLRPGGPSSEPPTLPAGDLTSNGLGIRLNNYISNRHTTASNTWAMRPASRYPGEHSIIHPTDKAAASMGESEVWASLHGEHDFHPISRGAGCSISFTSKGVSPRHRASCDNTPMPTPPTQPKRASIDLRAVHRRASLTSLHPAPLSNKTLHVHSGHTSSADRSDDMSSSHQFYLGGEVTGY